ncbi:aspartate aminotransferase family protein [Pontibacter sp. JAM-7]|uniref:aspartate aminotransferase family protein n=1 Tax=Pontibacter sp. JAM-7 TaxID=3366581 RepID=UPI003AF617FC
MLSTITRDLFDAYMVPNYAPPAVIPVRGKGSQVWDQAGKQYIDFAGGIAVTALGHCHPELVHTLQQQAEKLWHLSNVWTNEPALHLAQQLCKHTFAEKVYFANSGAEANEAAFKLARKYAHDHYGAEKHEIISFHNSFHGRTLFTVSVGGQLKYRQGFKPVPGGITHLPFNDIAALTAAISSNTCAVVLEPIQGEGGIIAADRDFLLAARSLCTRHNALLIYDEIQTGMGRTGSLFAYEHLPEACPDILTAAKALGGGFPIGAMLCRSHVAKAFNFGVHGSTYGGNPLACSVAAKALELINQPELLVGVESRHQRFIAGLTDINQTIPIFELFRGQGLLIGCVLKQQFAGKARQLLNLALEEGLMLLIAGPDVLRLAPALNIPETDIDEGLARLERAIQRFLANPDTML